MRIIPVLDLKGGLVVRASRGNRALYRPIETPLAGGAQPAAVAQGLRGLHPFETFYCADLDAIEGRPPNVAALDALRAMPDAPEIWLDAGWATRAPFEAALAGGGIRPVLGTETQNDAALLTALGRMPGLILSLDFFADGYRGPPDILETPALWPDTVIVMTLARVGAAAGPDFARLAEVKAVAGKRTIVAAGGIRDAADLESLSSMGVDAALMASALHDGSLTAAQLSMLVA